MSTGEDPQASARLLLCLTTSSAALSAADRASLARRLASASACLAVSTCASASLASISSFRGAPGSLQPSCLLGRIWLRHRGQLHLTPTASGRLQLTDQGPCGEIGLTLGIGGHRQQGPVDAVPGLERSLSSSVIAASVRAATACRRVSDASSTACLDPAFRSIL